jgi:hypothetical protein
MDNLAQRFSTQITPRPVFPKTYNYWTLDTVSSSQFYPSSLHPRLKKIFRDCLRSYNKIKYVLLANFFQLRKEKCSLTFLCYFLATRLKSSTSRYWVATRRLITFVIVFNTKVSFLNPHCRYSFNVNVSTIINTY